MRRIICIILICIFFVSLFTFNDTIIGENKGDYFYHSLPYTPLASKNNSFIIRYTYTNNSGFLVTETYDTVYVQMGIEDYESSVNSGLGQGWTDNTLFPIGWVIFGTNETLEDGEHYHLEDFQVFVVTSNNFEPGILNENSIMKVNNNDFSKPFANGVLYRNNIIYYPRIDTLTFLEVVSKKIESLDSPTFPTDGSVADYFTYVIDEVVYLGQILGAIFNSFGAIF